MTIKSIKTGFTGISALAGNDQWFSDFEIIASTLVTVATTDVNFDNIPQGYTHLQLRGAVLGSSAGQDFIMRVNGVSAANSYARHEARGTGATRTMNGNANTNAFDIVTNAADGTYPSVFITDILDYSNTSKNKTFRTLQGSDRNGSGSISLQSGLRLATAAITSINLYFGAGTVSPNSRISLYGIR